MLSVRGVSIYRSSTRSSPETRVRGTLNELEPTRLIEFYYRTDRATREPGLRRQAIEEYGHRGPLASNL